MHGYIGIKIAYFSCTVMKERLILMIKNYLKKKQYAKIKSYVEYQIDVSQRLADDISSDESTIKKCYIAQKVILEQVLNFIKREEDSE